MYLYNTMSTTNMEQGVDTCKLIKITFITHAFFYKTMSSTITEQGSNTCLKLRVELLDDFRQPYQSTSWFRLLLLAYGLKLFHVS